MKDIDDGTQRQALVASALRAYDRRRRTSRKDQHSRDGVRLGLLLLAFAAMVIVTTALVVQVIIWFEVSPTDAYSRYSRGHHPTAMQKCILKNGEEFCVAEAQQDPQRPPEN
jgi:hypothetical protein